MPNKKKKYIPLRDRDKRRRYLENNKIRKEMERLIKLEKGLPIKLRKQLIYRSDYSESITKEDFEDIKKRAKIKVKSNKKRKSKSVKTVSGGSTGLVQQKIRRYKKP